MVIGVRGSKKKIEENMGGCEKVKEKKVQSMK